MNGKTKSILLQVAFKGAVESGVVNEEQVRTYYELLLNLHDTLDIDADDGGNTRSNNRRRSNSKPAPQGDTFIYEGTLVEDFRAAKADPSKGLKPNFPDFKTANGQPIEGVTTANGAAWLYDQDGNPNEDVQPLVAAADEKVF